ncbi:MAG: sugar transferase [Fimbriimonas sp.]
MKPVSSIEAPEGLASDPTRRTSLRRSAEIRDRRPYYQATKRLFDFAVSAAAIVVLSPLFVLVGAAIAAQDGAPLLFTQIRVGMNGRRFRIYKFRTMVKDAEQVLRARPELLAEYRQFYKIQDDPRVSRLGRFLRATTLDELPQLFNVLVGDMSLVGPRPIVEPELEKYGESKHLYLAMKPGCAGLWQCSGRSDTSYADRVKLDEEYYRKSSLRYDAGVLWRTIVAIVLRRGAH